MDEKASLPGQYKGYSKPTYDGWMRSSQYITVRDGTRLAADIFRPTRDGKAAGELLSRAPIDLQPQIKDTKVNQC